MAEREAGEGRQGWFKVVQMSQVQKQVLPSPYTILFILPAF